MFLDIVQPQFFYRVLCSAILIFIVAKTVIRAGPLFGGIIAGVPMGLAPGFYFLIEPNNSEFLFSTALNSLIALNATQIFLLNYMFLAKLFTPIVCVIISVLVWFILALGLLKLNLDLISATFLYLFITYFARRIGRIVVLAVDNRSPVVRPRLLYLRAILGGLLIGAVTILSSQLGSELSGTLLAFPIGFALIAFIAHTDFDESIVIKVLFSTILGTISLATFCISFAILTTYLSSDLAFILGLLVAILATIFILFLQKLNI